MYVSLYSLACTHMHAHARAARKTHPSHMLTSLLPQNGETPIDIALNADNDEVKTAFAEHAIITDDNKNELLLACARIGLVPLLRALLQAGANAAHVNKVRVRTPSSKKLAKCL